MGITLEPMVFLAMGTLGVLLLGLTLTPLLSDRGVWTIRLRILALCLLAVGMVVFGVSFALAGCVRLPDQEPSAERTARHHLVPGRPSRSAAGPPGRRGHRGIAVTAPRRSPPGCG